MARPKFFGQEFFRYIIYFSYMYEGVNPTEGVDYMFIDNPKELLAQEIEGLVSDEV